LIYRSIAASYTTIWCFFNPFDRSDANFLPILYRFASLPSITFFNLSSIRASNYLTFFAVRQTDMQTDRQMYPSQPTPSAVTSYNCRSVSVKIHGPTVRSSVQYMCLPAHSPCTSEVLYKGKVMWNVIFTASHVCYAIGRYRNDSFSTSFYLSLPSSSYGDDNYHSD
jgi:hypothetical protein